MYEISSNSINIDDVFKKKFKYYKSNKPKPCLGNVISIDDSISVKVTSIMPENVKHDPRTVLLGLRNLREWKAYTFQDHTGLILIRNPFTAAGQRYWVRQCLEVYPRKPNKMNIDIEMNVQDWWQECFISSQCDRNLQKKLRWTTLGYHHNWDTKVYTEDNKSQFPEDLAELSDILAQYLGYEGFEAQAAIVNYYHMDSTLSAHTDHSEVNLEAPLFSVSFGQSAIFLIGGKDKSIEPSAILLQSGDIIVMSKDARLCYHAVPKILPAETTPWNDQDDTIKKEEQACDIKFKYLSKPEDLVIKMSKNLNDSDWNDFSNYIKESRINMNVRQVLNDKQSSLG
ncbi:2OG-Fe(II) oxygenase superfamily domain-containing protein [Phthorimaea operculella]|nr:2OG-Fe(II) oxygenase superfamily domain-containing protein [Phthorimaea operculella]